jgi:phosphotransacetylase
MPSALPSGLPVTVISFSRVGSADGSDCADARQLTPTNNKKAPARRAFKGLNSGENAIMGLHFLITITHYQ